MPPTVRFLDIGIRLHLHQWPGGDRVPFLLLHGLASNARTWDRVAELLHGAGHPVVAVDQRGHGLSDKPETGYDFATVAGDLAHLVKALGWSRPVVVGQSWGATVVLQFAAAHPGLARGIGCVDGGFMDLRMHPDPSWESVSRRLRPPNLLGTPRTEIEGMIRTHHSNWDDEGVEATLANFETLPDGTIRPWLNLGRHMSIVRAMWELDAASLFTRVEEPVLFCVARTGHMPPELRRRQVAAAEAGIYRSAVRWFDDTDHDIHVHRPRQLAQTLLAELESGVWAGLS